ncbi:MAG: hypothetical protein GY898_17820 [Proteobacteria bacterium]|nr:hypothetical protein [Pseudomonadota bacterium]
MRWLLALVLALAGCVEAEQDECPEPRQLPLPFAASNPDSDGDGWGWDEDCDPCNPWVFPNAPEVCNGVDDDCDAIIDDGFDLDLDGAQLAQECADGTDCDDEDPEIGPDVQEVCDDGLDNDCDGLTDRYDDACP